MSSGAIIFPINISVFRYSHVLRLVGVRIVLVKPAPAPVRREWTHVLPGICVSTAEVTLRSRGVLGGVSVKRSHVIVQVTALPLGLWKGGDIRVG